MKSMSRSVGGGSPPATAPIRSMDGASGTQTFPLERVTLAKSFSTPADDNVVRRRVRNPPTRTLSRAQSIRETLSSGAANFFGVHPKTSNGQCTEATEVERDNKWKARRLRHMSRRYGAVRDPAPDQMLPGLDDLTDLATHLPTSSSFRDQAVFNRRNLERPLSVDGSTQRDGGRERTGSTDTKGSKIRVLLRRDSVAKMAWDGLSTLVTKGSLRPKKPLTASTLRCRKPQSRSFSPGSLTGDDSVFDVSAYHVPSGSGGLEPSFKDIFGTEGIAMATIDEETRMKEEDRHGVKGHVCKGPPTPPIGRDAPDGLRPSYGRAVSIASPDTSLQDDVFFDLWPPGESTSPVIRQPVAPRRPEAPPRAEAPPSSEALPTLPQRASATREALPPPIPPHHIHKHHYRIPHHGQHRHLGQQRQPQVVLGRRPFEYPPVARHRQHLEDAYWCYSQCAEK